MGNLRTGGRVSHGAACLPGGAGWISRGRRRVQASGRAPRDLDGKSGTSLSLSDGSKLDADQYVFACGPWLGKLFPETVGDHIRPTKQDVFFFGTPAGDDRFTEAKLPVWADHRDRFMYGIPGNQGRGFKVADDTRGPEFDPTSGERTVSAEGLRVIRDYVAFRFPALKDAPLLESRVCQYENTPDNNFIIDRHPRHENVWLLGGGSGHGFKHGPALGEMVAGLVMEHKDPDELFQAGTVCKTIALLNLDYALAGVGFDLIHPRDHLAGEVVERFAGRGAFSGEHGGLAAVAGFADVGIELDFAQVGDSKLFRRLLRAAAGENIGLMIAVRANEVAHVLDHAHQVHLHLAEHFDGFARVLQRNVGRRGNHDRAGERNGLNQRQRHVSRARRQIHDQVVEFSPHHRAQKLLDDGMQHGAAPDQRLVAGIQETRPR